MTHADKTISISSEESERISILKVWLTFMIVFIHSADSNINFGAGTLYMYNPPWLVILKYTVSEVLSRVAVPAFFFLSAYFLFKKEFSWTENIIKKVKSLMVPYLIMNSFWVLFYFAAQSIPSLSPFFSNPDNLVSTWNLKDWLEHYFGSRANYAPLLYPLWFVRNLFILNVLAPVYKWFVQKTRYFSLIVFVILWLTLESTHIFFLDIQSVCFFGIGCFFAIEKISFSESDRFRVPAAVIYPCLVLASVLLRNQEGFIKMFICRLCFLTGMFFWYIFATRIKAQRLKDMLLFVARYSFCIYLFHEMNLSILRKILVRSLPHTGFFSAALYLGMPFVIISLCLLISRFLDRFIPGLYRIISGGRGAG